ncbi:MAG: HgcAB-associated protein [Dehalococcoidales bacterium]|nr:HgcAB-associated protein [Dehalococcoidales bacterium]
MKNKVKSKETCCAPGDCGEACCKVDAIVTIDERGQMVLPKDVREKAGIHAGDKLALIAWEKDGKICCLSLIKAEELSGMAKGVLGPMAKEIF